MYPNRSQGVVPLVFYIEFIFFGGKNKKVEPLISGGTSMIPLNLS